MNDDFKEELKDCYAEIEALRAEVEMLRGQHSGAVASYEAAHKDWLDLRAENAALREALEEVLWYTNQLEMQAYEPDEWPKVHDAVAKARAALAAQKEKTDE